METTYRVSTGSLVLLGLVSALGGASLLALLRWMMEGE